MLMCCLSCAKVDWCKQADRVEDFCINHEERTLTNADRIRAMSDEELAEMLYCIDHIVEDDWGDYDPHQLIMGHAFRDEEDILEWLKSPVTEM